MHMLMMSLTRFIAITLTVLVMILSKVFTDLSTGRVFFESLSKELNGIGRSIDKL